jgi:hypothetical protein
MKKTCGSLIDECLLISHCKHPESSHTEFFNYLESHPGIGLVSTAVRGATEENIRKRLGGYRYSVAMRELDRLETFLEIKRIPHDISRNNIKLVEEMFANIVKETRVEHLIRPWTSSPRFRGVAEEIYTNQIAMEPNRHILQKKMFYKPVDRGDKYIIADAIALKEEYEHMLIASSDEHLIDSFISKSIKDAFGIECGPAPKVLSKLREY